ncbi:MAG: amino acid-binding protein [Eggerthellaceae bacterium]
MGVSQISVFIESRPGHMSRVLESFNEARVSVRGYSASDTGITASSVSSSTIHDKALSVLEQMGGGCKTSAVLAPCRQTRRARPHYGNHGAKQHQRGIQLLFISTYIAISVKDLKAAEDILRGEPVELMSKRPREGISIPSKRRATLRKKAGSLVISRKRRSGRPLRQAASTSCHS